MLKSAVAILTYNRQPVLETTLSTLATHGILGKYPLAIFDDCSRRDNTVDYLLDKCVGPASYGQTYMADYAAGRDFQVWLGRHNLGVAKNTNRAIHWFEHQTDADHLMLLNDDIRALGNFVEGYAEAHEDTSIGMFCFTDFAHPTYKWEPINAAGKTKMWPIKKMHRMTGIAMSMTRECVKKIGYFNPNFRKFGQEHCEYTYRASFAGQMIANKKAHACLDVNFDPPLLEHQEVESSISLIEKPTHDKEAEFTLRNIAVGYQFNPWYVPFSLGPTQYVAQYGTFGIPTTNIRGYAKVIDPSYVEVD